MRSLYSLKYRIEPEVFGRTLSVSLTELETGRPVESESLQLYGPEGLLSDAGRKKSAYRFKIPKDVGTVKVKFDNYSKFIAIPADSSAIRVEFFPEGGALVAGVSNALAFRAVDADGRPADVRGTIADGSGATVAELATRANGIGQVRFIPAEGETYSASVAGRTYRLPAASADATALQVTAPRTPEESLKQMYAAMGIRTFGQKELDAKKITSYEEVIRTIPGLTIKNGAIYSNRRNSIFGGPAKVEIWIDGVEWNSSATISSAGALPTPRRKRQSKLTADGSSSVAEPSVASQSHTSDISEFDELTSSYPLSIVESIEYAPPHAALIISSTAAFGGGALIITTKGGSGKQWDADLFIQSHTPLGYQDAKEAYQPTDNWHPSETKKSALKLTNDEVTISGFTENGNFITATLKD